MHSNVSSYSSGKLNVVVMDDVKTGGGHSLQVSEIAAMITCCAFTIEWTDSATYHPISRPRGTATFILLACISYLIFGRRTSLGVTLKMAK